MNMMSKKNILLLLIILPVSLAGMRFHALAAEKHETVYTLQVASHKDVKSADQEFESLVQRVPREYLDYMRIEKIGKYYSLRIGKFGSQGDAEQWLKAIKSDVPSAVIMDAYFIEKRIVKLIAPVEKAPLPEDYKEAVDQPDQPEAAGQAEKSEDEKAEKREVPVASEKTVDQKIEAIALLVQQKDFDKALENVKAAYSEEPMHPELNAWYGAVLLKRNQPAEARQYLEQAVKLSPDVADFHGSLGYCLFFLDNLSAAADEFQKAVSLDSKHVDALAGLGFIYGKRGEKDKALEIHSALTNLNPEAADKILKIINQN